MKRCLQLWRWCWWWQKTSVRKAWTRLHLSCAVVTSVGNFEASAAVIGAFLPQRDVDLMVTKWGKNTWCFPIPAKGCCESPWSPIVLERCQEMSLRFLWVSRCLFLSASLSLSVPLCDFVSFLQVFSVTGPDSLDTPFHMFFTSHFDSQPRFYVIPFATLHILDLVKVTRHGTWSNNQTTWLNAHNAESRSRTLERRQSLSFEKHEPTSICVRSHISSL